VRSRRCDPGCRSRSTRACRPQLDVRASDEGLLPRGCAPGPMRVCGRVLVAEPAREPAGVVGLYDREASSRDSEPH
jgi:hypothetical protein